MARSKNKMTLDRVLSRHGLLSRKSAESAIQSGRVKVNGRVVRDTQLWIDPKSDTVHFDGEKVRQVRRTYLLLYKPKGVLSTHGDRRGRKTLYDCLDPRLPWVAPVGRLDKDTSGLILLTNDTEFSSYVTSPASKVPKTYMVKANILVDDTWLEIVLTEGKNREIHRLLVSVGLKVLKLVRTKIGPCTLEGLQVGQWRRLEKQEIARFYSKDRYNAAPSTPTEESL
ncbi:MAG: pseudouridine synthase [Acidobacteriota bacterium]